MLCIYVFAAISYFAYTEAQTGCADQPDGIYAHGCRSYTQCTGGVGTIVDCDPGYVVDYRAGYCRPKELVPPPCGDDNNCSNLADGRYPVLPDCRYFFTCQGGLDLGSNPCNNPPDVGDLVFDTENQFCNWSWNVYEPCGTLPA